MLVFTNNNNSNNNFNCNKYKNTDLTYSSFASAVKQFTGPTVTPRTKGRLSAANKQFLKSLGLILRNE